MRLPPTTVAHAQGREAVRAAVLQRGDLAVALPVEHHRLLQDGEAEHAAVAEVSDHAQYQALRR